MSTATVMPYRPLLNLGHDLAGREAAAEGPRVLWLHGYALDSSVWGELWSLLPGFHHVAVDLPGHGRSLPLGEKEQGPEFAARLLRVAAKHRARHLVALSSASLIALEMVCQQPEAFDSLVLGSPLPADGAAGEPFWRRYRELVNMQMIGGFGDHLRGRLMLVEPTVFEGARRREGLWDALWQTVGRHPFLDLGDAAMLRLGAEPDEVRLHRSSVPTLIVVGSSDAPGARHHAQRLESVLPGCKQVTVVGAGRLSLLEAPAVAAAAIEAHVRSHSGGAAQEER